MKTLLLIFALSCLIAPQLHAQATRETGGCGNPSSDYCAKLDGSGITVTEKGGMMGLCRLPDDSVIEEWTLFRKSEKAATAFLNTEPDMSSPHRETLKEMEAWQKSRCESRGGKIVLYPEPYRPTLKWALCVFDDNSRIDARTLAYGSFYYPQLTAALKDKSGPPTTCY